MNIYIASSWKNQHAVELLTAKLRSQGHEVVSWIENNYQRAGIMGCQSLCLGGQIQKNMSPIHLIRLIALVAAIAVVFTLAVLEIRKPPPTPSIPPPSVDAVRREIKRDSITERRAIRAFLIDSLNNAPRHEDNVRTVRSLSRRAQLDSLLAAPR